MLGQIGRAGHQSTQNNYKGKVLGSQVRKEMTLRAVTKQIDIKHMLMDVFAKSIGKGHIRAEQNVLLPQVHF